VHGGNQRARQPGRLMPPTVLLMYSVLPSSHLERDSV
jgi:hypothetical protein